jgi:hypothetical protein
MGEVVIEIILLLLPLWEADEWVVFGDIGVQEMRDCDT